jgi:hypothetical protein
MVARMRPLRLVPLLVALLLACGEEAPIPAGHTPPPPASTGPTTDPGLTSADSTTGASPCDCELGQHCAAEYVPGDPEPLLETFECRAECLPPAAPGFWCYDDTSCCDSRCREDGLCEPAPAETDGTTGASSTDASSTDASTTDASSSG